MESLIVAFSRDVGWDLGATFLITGLLQGVARRVSVYLIVCVCLRGGGCKEAVVFESACGQQRLGFEVAVHS